MKRRGLTLLLACAWLPLAGAQQVLPSAANLAHQEQHSASSYLVQQGHRFFVSWPGVNSAYALDSSIVEASAVPGGVELAGKMPGETAVILVTAYGVRTITATVPQPVLPAGVRGATGGLQNQTVEYGTYQAEYSNNPNQISNYEDLTQIAGQRRIHVQILNTAVSPGAGETPIGFPVLSYQISQPGRTITLVDEMIDNTPLTVTGLMVRGFHVQAGQWEFHAGITSVTQFQDFLLPSNRYEVFGLSRHFQLNRRSALEANFYDFSTNTQVNTAATPGPIATLYYTYARNTLHITSEVGAGNGIALAGSADSEGHNRLFQFSYQYQSPKVASLSINELHGRNINLNWTQKFGKHLQSMVSGNDTYVNMAQNQQVMDNLQPSETYWLTSHIGLMGGMTAARFISRVPPAPSVRSFGYQTGPQFQSAHFDGSFTIEQLHNSGNLPSSWLYSVNSQVAEGKMTASFYYDSQSVAPVFAPVQSSQPDLREVLLRESEAALNPAQMAKFLQETEVLQSQGYMQPLMIGIASQRNQYGVMVNWNGTKTGHLTFNGMVNTNRGGGVPNLTLTSGGVIWTRKLGPGNVINADFTMYRTNTGGQTSVQPSETFSLQHQLKSVPRWLVPGRHGTISGHVFADPTYTLVYRPGDKPLPGVLVYLDGRRSTHTDRNGYYSFRGVPFGLHSVEADYKSSRPFYFTSSSPKSVTINSVADFGISFAKGRIFGSFKSDAGLGVRMQLTVQGNGVQRNVSTDGDGEVEIEGLPYGTYTIIPDLTSVPPGYSLDNLSNQTVVVSTEEAGHFAFRVQAQRSISGKIDVLDPTTGKSIPLAGAVVSLGTGKPSATTDSQGRYLFRQLPPGTYNIVVTHGGKTWTRSVVLDPTPDITSGVDITVVQAPPRPPMIPPPAPTPTPTFRNRARRMRRRRMESRRRQTVARPRPTPADAGNERF